MCEKLKKTPPWITFLNFQFNAIHAKNEFSFKISIILPTFSPGFIQLSIMKYDGLGWSSPEKFFVESSD